MLEIILTLFGGILLGAGLLLAVALIAGRSAKKNRAKARKELHEVHADLVRQWMDHFDEGGILNYITHGFSEAPGAPPEEHWMVTAQRPGGKHPALANEELRSCLGEAVYHAEYMMRRYDAMVPGRPIPEGIRRHWENRVVQFRELIDPAGENEARDSASQLEEASTC